MPSQNGWPLSRNIVKRRVPGTRRSFWLNSSAAPVLLYVARRFHREVARIDVGTFDDWGYAKPTRIPGSSVYSNHGSGTAIDINATSYPWGLDRMGAKDTATCHRIEKACLGGVRWGGDYRGKIDQMHWEIDCAPSQILRVKDKMRLRSDGTQFPKITMTRTLRPGMKGADVAALRRRLGMRTGSKWGPIQSQKVKAWRKARGLSVEAACGPVMGRRLGWSVKY
jgi:hypothetical protein